MDHAYYEGSNKDMTATDTHKNLVRMWSNTHTASTDAAIQACLSHCSLNSHRRLEAALGPKRERDPACTDKPSVCMICRYTTLQSR